MTDTTNKIEMLSFEVEMRFPVEVSVEEFEQEFSDTPLDEVESYALEDFVRDRVHDAFEKHMQEMGDFDVDTWGTEKYSVPPPAEPAEEPHSFYTLPGPDLLGRFSMSEKGFGPVEESPWNRMTDEQLLGAIAAIRGVFSGRTIHKAQQDEIETFYREMEHIGLARPSMHTFKPYGEDASICHYCGQQEPGHRAPGEQEKD